MCRKDQPAASQMSVREFHSEKALEASIYCVEYEYVEAVGGLVGKCDGLDHPPAQLLLGAQRTFLECIKNKQTADPT